MNDLQLKSNELEMALLCLDKSLAENIIYNAVKESPAIDVASELITLSLQNIGNLWEEGKLALSQVYMSGVICEEIIDKILPPQSQYRRNQPKMAIGVFEDYHLLGKRIIYSGLRASGFEIMDLGGGLTIDKLVDIVKKQEIKILLLSVLMLSSALHIADLKQKLSDTDVKIIVGGAPFRLDEELWREVGADAYGRDAAEVIKIVNELIAE